MVRPVTVAVVGTTVLPSGAVTVTVTGAVTPAALDVTVYELMALPPFDAGAVQDTVAWALPAVAVTAVGAPGTVAGVTLLDASDAALVPTAFVAVTVKV